MVVLWTADMQLSRQREGSCACDSVRMLYLLTHLTPAGRRGPGPPESPRPDLGTALSS
jgi:hypothetical protein